MSNNKNLKRFGSSKEGKLGLDPQAKSIFTNSAVKRQSFRLAGKPAPVLFNNKAMKEAAELMDNSRTGEEDDNNSEEAGIRGEETSQVARHDESQAQEEESSSTSPDSSLSAPIRNKPALKVVAVHDTAPI